MDALPLLPKTKSAWVSSLVLTISLFLYYYPLLYPGLLETYKDKNWIIPYTYKQNASLTNDLDVYLVVPKFLGANIVEYATVSLYNLKDEPVYVKVRLIQERKSQDATEVNDGLSVAASVENAPSEGIATRIDPKSFVYIQLPLILYDQSINTEELYISLTILAPDGSVVGGEEKLSTEKTGMNPVVNPIYSSFNVLLTNLLLPPVANVLLPALAIMSCWFVEDGKENDGIVYNKVLRVFGIAAIYSFIIITAFYFLEVGTRASLFVLGVWLIIIWIYVIGKIKIYRELWGKICDRFNGSR